MTIRRTVWAESFDINPAYYTDREHQPFSINRDRKVVEQESEAGHVAQAIISTGDHQKARYLNNQADIYAAGNGMYTSASLRRYVGPTADIKDTIHESVIISLHRGGNWEIELRGFVGIDVQKIEMCVTNDGTIIIKPKSES